MIKIKSKIDNDNVTIYEINIYNNNSILVWNGKVELINDTQAFKNQKLLKQQIGEYYATLRSAIIDDFNKN